MSAAAVRASNDAWLEQALGSLALPVRLPISFDAGLQEAAGPNTLDVASALQHYRNRLDAKSGASEEVAASLALTPHATRSATSSPAPSSLRSGCRPLIDAASPRPLSTGSLAVEAIPQPSSVRAYSPQHRACAGHVDGIRTLDAPQTVQARGLTLSRHFSTARITPALKASKSRIWKRARATPVSEKTEDAWDCRSGAAAAGPALAPQCFDEMMANLLWRTHISMAQHGSSAFLGRN